MIDSLARALRAGGVPCMAFTGAGGKTTAMFSLARDLLKRGHSRVVVSTTTHLAVAQAGLADHHITLETGQDAPRFFLEGVTLVTGSEQADGRFRAPEPACLEALLTSTRSQGYPLLLEADGSRMRPLKAPGDHEPVVPGFVTDVVVMAGLSGLLQPLDQDTVHRPEQFAALSGLRPGDPISPDALVRVLLHPKGGLKGIPAYARRVACLNQADSDALQSMAGWMARHLLAEYDAVLVTELNRHGEGLELSPPQIFAVHEKVAGIVLAAGDARRFGSPKQLLPWKGEPLVRHAARAAVEAGLSPVVVVAGEQFEAIQAAVGGLPVEVRYNPDWQDGQSTSLRAGLACTPREAGGVIFLLADQPQVPVGLVQALVEAHTSSLAPITAPLVDGQRGNPVIFDRSTFGDLMALSGDQGGRGIFSKHPVVWLPWHDRLPLLDIDTPDDYARLQEME